MIIRRIFFAFALLVGVACACAQELTVEGMELSGSDLSASTERRVDNKGKNCALVKVQLAAPDVQFEGNIIEPVKFKEGEYWVYMSEGSSQLTIKQPDYPSLAVNFVDYAIDGVRSLTTYVLTINVPSDGTVDDGKRFLSLFVEQAGGSGPLFEEDEVLARRFIELFDVKVYVDDLLQELHNGRVTILLSRGKHTYRVEHEGYITVMDTIDIVNDNISRYIDMKKVKVNVTITCPTPGVTYYMQGKEYKTSPLNTKLDAGSISVEARHEGYRTKELKVKLNDKESDQTISFPALEPIEGSVSIEFIPSGCEVYIDGIRMGTSPGAFGHQIIGRHVVEVRKEGYHSEDIEIFVVEGQQTTIKGSMLSKGEYDMSTSQMVRLGEDYYSGSNGKKENFTEAINWYRKAAELGNARAQYLYGRMLEDGNGTEATKWFKKSAEQGNRDGQYKLAECYIMGYSRGLNPDMGKAMYWYEKAAAQGHRDAINEVYKKRLREKLKKEQQARMSRSKK